MGACAGLALAGAIAGLVIPARPSAAALPQSGAVRALDTTSSR
jgi:hypothetical protein